MRKLIRYLLISSLTFVGQQAYADQEKPVIRVGAIIPLSGPYMAVGEDFRQGAEVAKSEVEEEQQINLIFGDSKAEPALAVSEFRKLIDLEKVPAMLVIRGPAGMAVNQLSKSAKIPLLGAVANKTFAASNPYAFQVWPRSDFEGEFLAKEILKTDLKTIAVLTVQDDYPITVSESFKNFYSSNGGRILFNQEVLPTENDFRSQVAILKKLNPQAIFINLALSQIAPFLKQTEQQSLGAKLFSNFWLAKKEVLAAAGGAAEGASFVEMSLQLPKLRLDLEKNFNSSPSAMTLSGYLSVLMLAQGLQSSEDSNQIYSRLNKIEKIKTKNGDFEVKDRVIQFPLALKKIINGKSIE